MTHPLTEPDTGLLPPDPVRPRRPHLVVLPDVDPRGDACVVAAEPSVADIPAQVDRERWLEAWQHRPILLGLARQRVETHVAEDIVSEAMLRAATSEPLRGDALRPWLVTTTLRLCADDHRRRQRERRRDLRLATYDPPAAPGVDEHVVDEMHARWLAAQVDRLPERQARALWLRAHGHDVTAIAVMMVLPYKTVESLLSRGRHSLRDWAGAVVLFCGGWRVIAKRKAQFHVAAAGIAATGDLTYEMARVATGIVTKSF
jgi:RNA polymerase sigma factor (sigma-70 family)